MHARAYELDRFTNEGRTPQYSAQVDTMPIIGAPLLVLTGQGRPQTRWSDQ
jgi:hypothetical protein